jgi:hypothetical protein
MFSVIETPELFISQHNAKALADKVQAWGYRARVWNKHSLDRTERGYAVAVYSNNGFEGFAHDL